MTNQVYKCERCGKLYILYDLEKHDKETSYSLVKAISGGPWDNRPVGLCDECAMELTDWMERGTTMTAPEKKEETPNYEELMLNALAKELIEHVMRTNGKES